MGKRPSCTGIYDWYNKFSEDCTEVSNLPHAHVQPTAVRNINIRDAEELILGNKRSTVCDTASNSGTSVGSAETIIHELISMKYVSARSQRC
jgi:hypothetical protein